MSLPLCTVAILAKNAALHLPTYLDCLLGQTYPKDKILLYIRTNDNRDQTAAILAGWVQEHGYKYAKIYFNTHSVHPGLTETGNHDWTPARFRIMAQIRQASVYWAAYHRSHYFTVDADCYIIPETIESMVRTGLPVVAPFLKRSDTIGYSNMHVQVTENGYFKDCPEYFTVWGQALRGLHNIECVHIAYYIRSDMLLRMRYFPTADRFTEEDRYEYILFSENCRQQKIPQFLCNEKIFGVISFACTEKQLAEEDSVAYYQKIVAIGEKQDPVFRSYYGS